MLYWLERCVVRALFRILTRWEVIGLENVPPQGPFIVITNHLSMLDPPAVMAALPCRVIAMAASKYIRHPFGFLLGTANVIFVRRGEADRRALRKALAVLASGGVLGIAPEGTRSKTGALQRGKPGAAYLALRANVPLLPVVLTGTERVFREFLRFRRPHVRVVIGEPFHLAVPEGAERPLQALTDQMMHRLAALLPPEYRGVYGQTSPRPTLRRGAQQATEAAR
jgi:1-acyl-sn-glycerol-3-phosphate acyltransferase